MRREILIYILSLIITSCSPGKKLTHVDFSGEYRENRPEAAYAAYHISQDTSVFYYSIRSKSLLYKKHDDGSFNAKISFHFSLYPAGSRTSILDSITQEYIIPLDTQALYHNGGINFYAMSGNNYYLTVELIDNYRGQAQVYGLSLNKTDNDEAEYYIPYDDNGQPLLNRHVKPGERITITRPASTSADFILRSYFDDFPLAPPPFATGSFKTFDFHSDSSALISIANPISFSRKGIHFLQKDTMTNEGLAFVCMTSDFPSITTPEELIHALRYISTQEEYNKLAASADVKKAVDDYWLQKAGNNERGRKLIKTYYGRAQEANRLFTSYLEGWKSDRGMIYIIFGPPDNVYRINGEETWRFNFRRGMPDIQFIFRNVKNPFTANDFQLLRDPYFQNIWYLAVDSWRSGRIVGEY